MFCRSGSCCATDNFDRDGDDQCLLFEPNNRLNSPAGLRIDLSASSSQ